MIETAAINLKRKLNPKNCCGCKSRYVQGKGSRSIAWKGVGDISSSWWYKHVLSSTNRSKNRRKGILVDVTIEQGWLLFCDQEGRCALTGMPLVIADNFSNTASIDRIDSQKGYSIDNIQWVHKHINYMKQSYDQDYFIEMCIKVAQWAEQDQVAIST